MLERTANDVEQASLPRLKVIKVGTLCLQPAEPVSTLTWQIKAELGIGGGSTVTLIEAGRRLLVDTGFDHEWLDSQYNVQRNHDSLKRVLQNHMLAPEQIDAVFVTHWHRDHFGNLDLFTGAELLACQGLVDSLKLPGFTGIADGQSLTEGVTILPTPGHTADHASVIVKSILSGIRARVAIAGDAVISAGYFHSGRIWQHNADFYDIELARQSMLRLQSAADVIIPGHGVPFMSYRPDWARTRDNPDSDSQRGHHGGTTRW